MRARKGTGTGVRGAEVIRRGGDTGKKRADALREFTPERMYKRTCTGVQGVSDGGERASAA